MKKYPDDVIDYFMKDACKRKFEPYPVSNPELADGLYECIKQEYPNALMFRYRNRIQYIVITEKARLRLIELLKDHIDGHMQDIADINGTLEKIKEGRIK